MPSPPARGSAPSTCVGANGLAQARNLVVSHKMTVGALLAMHSEETLFHKKEKCDISVQAISVAPAGHGGMWRATLAHSKTHLFVRAHGRTWRHSSVRQSFLPIVVGGQASSTIRRILSKFRNLAKSKDVFRRLAQQAHAAGAGGWTCVGHAV